MHSPDRPVPAGFVHIALPLGSETPPCPLCGAPLDGGGVHLQELPSGDDGVAFRAVCTRHLPGGLRTVHVRDTHDIGPVLRFLAERGRDLHAVLDALAPWLLRRTPWRQ